MEAKYNTTDHETLPMLPSRSPGRRYPQKTVAVAAICAFALGAIGASIVPAPQKATTGMTSLTTVDKQRQELVLKNVRDCSASIDTCVETEKCLKDYAACLGQVWAPTASKSLEPNGWYCDSRPCTWMCCLCANCHDCDRQCRYE